MNPDWDGRMKAQAQKSKAAATTTLDIDATRKGRQIRSLRIALEAIYGTPELMLAEARMLAHRALEDTE